MLKDIMVQTKHSLIFVAVFTVLLGLVYPGLTTLLGKALFPRQADGSLIEVNGKRVGSELIGQSFDDPKYFWSRPSATGPYGYNASSSTGSNLGPTNPGFLDTVQGRIDALKKADPDMAGKPIPMDLVTASGSGLDPHISPAAAEYQASRVAKTRKLPLEKVKELIAQNTQGRWLGFIGDPGVNVLKLNLALDALVPAASK
ncbi:MAG TPA: potassium-transporting ATPase subunit KdpC [bacterium]|nr:potassium-transporting ATPase subunit KdpC [bacterium]